MDVVAEIVATLNRWADEDLARITATHARLTEQLALRAVSTAGLVRPAHRYGEGPRARRPRGEPR